MLTISLKKYIAPRFTCTITDEQTELLAGFLYGGVQGSYRIPIPTGAIAPLTTRKSGNRSQVEPRPHRGGGERGVDAAGKTQRRLHGATVVALHALNCRFSY